MIGFIVTIILVNDTVKSYLLLALILFSLLVITIEVIITNRGGFDLTPTKVYPEPEEEEEVNEVVRKKSLNKSGKYI